ncbi:MAG: aminoacyl-tRNA hydrolase [Candidatus Parcubacteria bacterium]|nr:aminoacyl-tRNA hydrolase [Candidatus Parcubacteria bacterium]
MPYLVVGLGNPGKKYARTRHNAGWLVLDYAWPAKWQKSKNTAAAYYQTEMAGQPVELLKPLSFMNNSGQAVSVAAKKHQIAPAHIIVVHDDKDIALGQLKIQTNRGDAGHNGVKSIIAHLKTRSFVRIRVGIKPLNDLPAGQLVLKNFSAADLKIIKALSSKIKEAIELVIAQGLPAAMNKFNPITTTLPPHQESLV